MSHNPNNRWFVKETACYPNSWKVSTNYYIDSNSPSNFFPSKKEALKESNRRNEKEN